MPLWQRIELLGHWVQDAETKVSANGRSYLNGTIATQMGYGQSSSTLFVDVVAFGSLAERMGKLKKGDLVFAYGQLQTRERPLQNGTTAITWSVLLDQCFWLRSAVRHGSAPRSDQTPATTQNDMPEPTDDVDPSRYPKSDTSMEVDDSDCPF